MLQPVLAAAMFLEYRSSSFEIPFSQSYQQNSVEISLKSKVHSASVKTLTSYFKISSVLRAAADLKVTINDPELILSPAAKHLTFMKQGTRSS